MYQSLCTALKDNLSVIIVTEVYIKASKIENTFSGFMFWCHLWFYMLVSVGYTSYQIIRNIWTKFVFGFIPQHFFQEWLHTPTLFIVLVSYPNQIPSGLVPGVINDQSLSEKSPKRIFHSRMCHLRFTSTRRTRTACLIVDLDILSSCKQGKSQSKQEKKQKKNTEKTDWDNSVNDKYDQRPIELFIQLCYAHFAM